MTLGGLTTAAGDINILLANDLTVSRGIQAGTGNIGIITTGAGSDLTIQAGINGISSTGGTTTLIVGGNLILGTASNWGDVRGQRLVLTAGGNIVLDNATYAQADGAAGLQITAGGDISILRAISAGSVFNANAGGAPITITTGTNGTFTLDQGSNGGVGANGGTITLTADNATLTTGAIGTTGAVILKPVSAARTINLGSNIAGSLSLTDAEIDLINAGTLTIGSPTAGAITFSAAINPANTTWLNLSTVANIIDSNAAGVDITVATLDIFAPTGVATSADPLEINVDTLLTNCGGANSDQFFAEADSLSSLHLLGSGIVSLSAGGAIQDSDGVLDVVASSAKLASGSGIGTAANPIGTNVDTLAAQTTVVGGIFIRDNGNLNISNVSGASGLDAVGAIDVRSTGFLAASAIITATGDINLSADDSTGGGNDLGVHATLQSTGGGNITLTAGDNFVLFGNISTTGAVTISIDPTSGDPDPVGGLFNLFGTITGSSIALNGGDDNDLFGFVSSIIANAYGDLGDDTFDFGDTGSLGTGTIDGAGGTDVLTGDDDGNDFSITGANSGALSGKTSGWSNIEYLSGGAGADTFTLNGGSLSGSLQNFGSGDLLQGSGTLGAPLTVGGTINPGIGATIGTINLGNLFAGASSNFVFDIDGVNATADKLIVNGTVILNSASSSFNFSNVSAGQVFTLIDNDGSDAIVGTLVGLAEGASFSLGGGLSAVYSYLGGNGNDFIVSIVPTTVYVSPTFIGVNGSPVTDADLGTTGNQGANIGSSAFSIINDALPVGGIIIVNSGSYGETVNLVGARKLEITGPDASQAVTIEDLTTAAGTTVMLEGASTLSFGDVDNRTLAGAIVGTGSLSKAGAGTATLSAVNTYTGTTTINSGTLLVNGSLAAGSAVTVNNGGTLGGTGTVNGTVTVNSGGTLGPGLSPGILHTGSVTFNSGSSYSVEINGATLGTQYDQLDVTGSVNLSNAVLALTVPYTATIGDSFTVVNNDGSDAINGTFNGLAEGALVNFNGVDMQISYIGGDGNDVVLTAVPTFTPVVSIVATDAAAAEAGSDPGSFTISRTGPTGSALTVNYTIGGTSVAGDYTPVLTGTATILAGSSSVTINISPIDDAMVEGSETLTLTLTDAAAYDLGVAGSETAGVVITDNDRVIDNIDAPLTAIIGLPDSGHYQEGQLPQQPEPLWPALAFQDTDGGMIQQATVKIEGFILEDWLLVDPFITLPPLFALYDNIHGVLTITGNASQAVYQQVLQTVRFFTTKDITAPETRNLVVTVTDIHGHQVSADTEMHISPSIIIGTPLSNTLDGTYASDLIQGLGANDRLNGFSGDDRLEGGDGADTLMGGANDDWLFGGKGNDVMQGGIGNDRAYGGAGDDLFNGNSNGIDRYWGGTGRDTVNYGASTDGVSVSLANTGLQEVSEESGLDALIGIENLGGSDFNDTLVGNALGNRLIGYNGNDRLIGGFGRDTLTGGAGADRFIFNTAPAANNLDIVTDFKPGQDIIVLSANVFTAYAGQIGERVGLSANLAYNAATGILAYDADGAGAGTAVEIALLGNLNHPAALGQDFLIGA